MTTQPTITSDLYNELREPLKSFIAKRVSDSATVEDLLHDVFLRIHSRMDLLKEPGKVTSWIYQIARNTVIDYYRRKKSPTAEVTEDLMISQQADSSDAAEKLAPVVRSMIDQLPERYSKVLRMADLDGIKYSDIAAEFRISVSAVKSRVQRGRRMLRDLLLQCCHLEFDMYGTIFGYSPRNCTRCCSTCEADSPGNRSKACN